METEFSMFLLSLYFVFYYCITNYHKSSDLNLTQIYYLIVSVSQESGHSLDGSSTQGLLRLSVGCGCIKGSTGEDLTSKLPLGVAEFFSLQP